MPTSTMARGIAAMTCELYCWTAAKLCSPISTFAPTSPGLLTQGAEHGSLGRDLNYHGREALTGLHQKLVNRVGRNVERVTRGDRVPGSARDRLAPDLIRASGFAFDHLAAD